MGQCTSYGLDNLVTQDHSNGVELANHIGALGNMTMRYKVTTFPSLWYIILSTITQCPAWYRKINNLRL